jgi:hypothetical protein
MSFEFAERFWFFANDNGGQPSPRVEGPFIRSADDPTNFRFTRAPGTKHRDVSSQF